jgi:histidinol-phosphate phosphatase family protein
MEIDNVPIIQHQIELLSKYHITDILLLVSYQADQIKEYLGDGLALGVKLTYCNETIPLGTAGSVKAAEDLLKGESEFLVIYGDVMLNMNLSELINFHHSKAGIATLVVHPNSHPYDSDLVELDSNSRVIAIHNKPHEPSTYYQNLVNAGIYVLSVDILRYIQKEKKMDFGRDIFPELVGASHPSLAMYGYRTAEYMKDMGTPERLEQVRNDYKSGKIDRLNKSIKRKAIFLDRDGIINEDTGFIHTLDQFSLMPNVTKAISKLNESEYLVIVVTNQPVIARNMCTVEELNTIHKKMDTLLGKGGAFIDKLYYCPHHPDGGFPEEKKELKIECGCRKPRPGLVLEAAKEYNIDLAGSWIIGDSWRDVSLGKTLGIKTILVNQKEDQIMQPDYSFDTLNKAVDFILG